MLPDNATPKTPQLKPAKPWLAALLNAWPIPFGVGYLYLHNYWRFVSAFGLQILLPLVLAVIGLRNISSYALAALWLYTVVDAYNQARDTQ